MRTLAVRHSTRAAAAQALSVQRNYASNVSLNKRINQCTNVEELEQIIDEEPTHAFNSINCATAIYRLGRVVQHKAKVSHDNGLYGKLMSICGNKTFAPQALTNVCQGIAIGKLEKKIPLAILEQIFAMPMPSFKPMDVSTLAWSFATLNQPNADSWLEQVAELLLSNGTEKFPVRDVVTLLWSFAKLNHTSFHKVFQHVFLRIQFRKLDLRMFTNQDLAMLAWACTQLMNDDTLLARKMLRLISDHIYQDNRIGLTVQDMSSLLWSFAFVHPQGKSTSRVFDRLEKLLMKEDFRSNNAMTTTPQALANVLWSLATVKRENAPLLERVFNALLDKPAQECTGQDASNALWSLAKLRHMPARNFDTLQFDSFSNQALINTLWALAVLGLRPTWLGDLVKTITSKPSPLDFPVFSFLWSLACLDLLDDDGEHSGMVKEFLYKEKQVCTCTCLEDAMQLQQFKLAWPRNVALPSMVSEADIDILLRQIPEPESSHVHLKIASLLQAKLPKHVLIVNECNTLPNLFGIAVDMYIPSKDLVIEVDGPDHYLLDGKSLLGSAIFKHRLITKQGLDIISIPVNTTPQWIRAQEENYIQELADRIHPPSITEKKRFECPICHKRFARLTHMNRHQSAAH